MASKFLCEHSLFFKEFSIYYINTQLIVFQFGQSWDEGANRVNGWDRAVANQRMEIFRKGKQDRYFYASLANESHEPHIETLGKHLKDQKILTVHIFYKIGGLKDPHEYGVIYPEWNSLWYGESRSYQRNSFEFHGTGGFNIFEETEKTPEVYITTRRQGDETGHRRRLRPPARTDGRTEEPRSSQASEDILSTQSASQTNSRPLRGRLKTPRAKEREEEFQRMNTEEDIFLDAVPRQCWGQAISQSFRTTSENREEELWSHYLKMNEFRM